MNARHALAAVMISALAASPAAATVLSASGQAVGTRPSKADYLRVTEVQKDLNATMADVNDAAVAAGPLSASAPTSTHGGYVLAQPFHEGLDQGPVSGSGTSAVLQAPGGGSNNFRFGNGGRGNHGNNGGGNRRHGGGGGGRHGGGGGGGPHATPEPSTWTLLGTGLALFGGYVTLRRRIVEG